MRIVSILIVIVTTFFSAFAQQGDSKYKIISRFPVVGDGSWDYLTMDESTHRLFISHGNEVQVLDVRSGKLAGTIPDTRGVHGIALAGDLNKGFISNGKDTSVTVIDDRTLKVIDKVKVTGFNPDAILYDPFSKRIFTFNGRGDNSTVIDAKTDKVIGTIPLEGKPEFAVSDGKGKVFVNIEDKSRLSVIDPLAMKVVQSWSLAPGEEPSGLAFDPKSERLFSVCSNKLMVVMDALTGKVITTLPIGSRVDGAAFDPGNMRIYSSNGEGTLTVVGEENANSFRVLENVKTQPGARTIALDLTTHRVYLPTAEYGPAPAPGADNPRPRPAIKPGSFVILELAPAD